MSAMNTLSTLNMRTFGKGPDLALLHGWGLGSFVWTPVLEMLARRCRVHLIDLPGYGGLSEEFSESAENTDDFLATARQLIDALPHGVVLGGWSLGSLLALQIALLAPERIAGLILVGSTPSFIQRNDWLIAQAPALLDRFAEAAQQDPRATLRRFIALFNQGDAKARTITRTLTDTLNQQELPSNTTLQQGLHWLRDVDLRAQISKIDIPTLLIHGEHDPLMPLAGAQWLAQHLPQARLEIFTAAAHAPFLAKPERFATLVGDFCHDSV